MWYAYIVENCNLRYCSHLSILYCRIDAELVQNDISLQGMTIRFVITIAIFQFAISECYAVNGIIWRKQKQEFVQLFSIPQFAALQKENLAKRRAMEMQDMSGEVVKAVSYEVRTCGSKESNMQLFYYKFFKDLPILHFFKFYKLLQKLCNEKS